MDIRSRKKGLVLALLTLISLLAVLTACELSLFPDNVSGAVIEVKNPNSTSPATSPTTTFSLAGSTTEAADFEPTLDLKDYYPFVARPEGRGFKEAKSAERFCIKLFLQEQFAAVYSRDEAQEYKVLQFLFPISSGYVSGHTPLGNHRLGMQSNPSWLFDNSIAQYGSQIKGNILFHSLPSYGGSIKEGISIADLNAMGYPASHGCVRLFYQDAKWIFENCPPGTRVEILESRGKEHSELPAKLKVIKLKEDSPTWDPSDDDPANPYHDLDLLRTCLAEWPADYVYIPHEPFWPEYRAEISVTETNTADIVSPTSTGATPDTPPTQLGPFFATPTATLPGQSND